MDCIEKLRSEIEKGFTKTFLEKQIGLPKNSLASYLTGVKKMTKANEARVVKFFEQNPNLDILVMPRRTRGLSINLSLEDEFRSNPLINAARGRDENGINNDELRQNKPRQAQKPQMAIQVPKKEEKPVEPIKIAKPERMKGESGLDYSIRLHEWQEKMNQLPI
jgi:hypothetical protein